MKKSNQRFTKWVIFLFTVTLCIPNIYGYFTYNMSQCAFSGECPEPDGAASASSGTGIDNKNGDLTLGQLIADGGSHFLKSLSAFNRLLSRVEASEVSGVDFDAFQEAVNQAIDSMTEAHTIYGQLKNRAEVTPYNDIVINKLLEFDYTGFQKNSSLTPTIFHECLDVAVDRFHTFKKTQAYL